VVLLARAKAMKAQLRKLWDPSQRYFADKYMTTNTFSTKLTPTAVYPMLGGAEVVTEEQASDTVNHLGNASELCVSGAFATAAATATAAAVATEAAGGGGGGIRDGNMSVNGSVSGNGRCYWGLPSVSRSDVSFMEPQSYIYWRGNTWGPMTLLTYWALAEYVDE
jgi:hypothetical protein